MQWSLRVGSRNGEVCVSPVVGPQERLRSSIAVAATQVIEMVNDAIMNTEGHGSPNRDPRVQLEVGE